MTDIKPKKTQIMYGLSGRQGQGRWPREANFLVKERLRQNITIQ